MSDSPYLRVSRIEAEIAGVSAQFGIDSRTKEFLSSVKSRWKLSDAQEKWLSDIERRVFSVGRGDL